MELFASCPICEEWTPFRTDRRGGRYFRCGFCQIAVFFSGKKAIAELEEEGTWSFQVSSFEEE